MSDNQKNQHASAQKRPSASRSTHNRYIPEGMRKLCESICALVILVTTVAAISAKKTSAVVFLLVVCAVFICALLLLIVDGMYAKMRAATRKKRSTDAQHTERNPHETEKSTPARYASAPTTWRPVIDIPLDDVPAKRAAQAAQVKEPEPVSAQPVDSYGTADELVSEVIRGVNTEPAAAAKQPKPEPVYKITPPKHNPEVWKKPNTRIVIWPDGRVEPASKYAFNYDTAEIEQEPEITPPLAEPASEFVDSEPPETVAFDFDTAAIEPEADAALEKEDSADNGVVIDFADALQKVLAAKQSKIPPMPDAAAVRRPEKVAESPTEEPKEEPVENPVGEPTEKPVEKPIQKPAEELTLEPVAEPAEKFAAESAAEPAAHPEEARAEKRSDVIYLPESLEPAQPKEAQEAAVAEAKPLNWTQEAPETDYAYPPIELLNQPAARNIEAADAELRYNAERLSATLGSFGVEAAAGEAVRGPSVTRYEFTLEPGVKLSKVTNLQDDIALALGAVGVRIAPIPDKQSVIGIEVPNRMVSPVSIRTLLESPEFTQSTSSTAFAVGEDISGRRIIGDISRFPHVLIAGTTGSGKSVCTNSLIVSMLYKSTPDEVRFIMVDPKMVELAPYNGIPHLLIPVVTDPKKAAGALQWAVYEMMKRYKLFSEHGVKDLATFNELAKDDPSLKKLPTVVVVIDELADLMLIAAKEVEESICRVAQMGRAAGMHLVIATQSPRADVITGLMKANIPSRIAFAVASSLESRIILDNTGAEKLVGKGDMLYAPLGQGKPQRVQGCFISAAEIERVVEFLKANGETDYDSEVIEQIEQAVAAKEESVKTPTVEEPPADGDDELLEAAVDVILETGQASTSMLQRRLKLGYSRAARIVDQMEERGIVGPFEGSKPRKILVTRESWAARKEQMP